MEIRKNILTCTCKHEFQDEEYGKQKRVHTPLAEDKPYKWRCTVCSKEKS